MEETIAYVYKWTYKPTYKWYIGSRTAKGCNPDDGYICSSKIVKPMIKSNPDEWIREIIATGKPEEMRELEAELLDLFDAKNDTRSFNMHNGDGKFTTAGKIHSDESRAKMSAAKKGKPGKPHNEEHRAKISAANKGKTHNEETRAKMSASRKGRTFTEEHRAKMSASNKGKTHSPETRAKMSAANKGITKPIITCPHCNKSGGEPLMKRWHFDKCKDNING